MRTKFVLPFLLAACVPIAGAPVSASGNALAKARGILEFSIDEERSLVENIDRAEIQAKRLKRFLFDGLQEAANHSDPVAALTAAASEYLAISQEFSSPEGAGLSRMVQELQSRIAATQKDFQGIIRGSDSHAKFYEKLFQELIEHKERLDRLEATLRETEGINAILERTAGDWATLHRDTVRYKGAKEAGELLKRKFLAFEEEWFPPETPRPPEPGNLAAHQPGSSTIAEPPRAALADIAAPAAMPPAPSSSGRVLGGKDTPSGASASAKPVFDSLSYQTRETLPPQTPPPAPQLPQDRSVGRARPAHLTAEEQRSLLAFVHGHISRENPGGGLELELDYAPLVDFYGTAGYPRERVLDYFLSRSIHKTVISPPQIESLGGDRYRVSVPTLLESTRPGDRRMPMRMNEVFGIRSVATLRDGGRIWEIFSQRARYEYVR